MVAALQYSRNFSSSVTMHCRARGTSKNLMLRYIDAVLSNIWQTVFRCMNPRFGVGFPNGDLSHQSLSLPETICLDRVPVHC